MRAWRALALAAVLPLAGCVFAVGSGDGEKEEALRDRVRELERRVERLEDSPPLRWVRPGQLLEEMEQ